MFSFTCMTDVNCVEMWVTGNLEFPLEGNAASSGNPKSRDGEVSRDVKWCNAIAVAGPVLLQTHHTFKLTGVQETLETLSFPSSRGWWRKKCMQALTPMGWEHCTKLCTRERWLQQWPRWMDLSYLSPQPWISFIGGLCLAFSRTPSPGSRKNTYTYPITQYIELLDMCILYLYSYFRDALLLKKR